jgi:hypothetical protein
LVETDPLYIPRDPLFKGKFRGAKGGRGDNVNPADVHQMQVGFVCLVVWLFDCLIVVVVCSDDIVLCVVSGVVHERRSSLVPQIQHVSLDHGCSSK